MTPRIRISLAAQELTLLAPDGAIEKSYSVSTAANGGGEINGSLCTPRGLHVIRAKIGAHARANTIFVGRRSCGKIFTPDMRANEPERDWILTRILWLSGLEPGVNRLGNVDSMRRYIYLHGSPDDVPMGAPGSHGCIRMRNRDVMELFDAVEVGARVQIDEHD